MVVKLASPKSTFILQYIQHTQQLRVFHNHIAHYKLMFSVQIWVSVFATFPRSTALVGLPRRSRIDTVFFFYYSVSRPPWMVGLPGWSAYLDGRPPGNSYGSFLSRYSISRPPWTVGLPGRSASLHGRPPWTIPMCNHISVNAIVKVRKYSDAESFKICLAISIHDIQ